MTETESSEKKLHIAVIMDGNGRWAQGRGLPRTMGHRAGIEALRRTVKAVKNFPIGYLTVYAFSAENWQRPEDEVSELMRLLRFYLKNELESFHKEGLRVRVIGERARLPKDIIALVDQAEGLTRDNKALTLTFALSYGGRQEIVAAARRLAQQAVDGALKPEAIDQAAFSASLYTDGLPDPDLVIRTSGEKRISNFLLWQSAYAEYVFLDVLWPDFSEEHLRAALEDFRSRDRRYGKSA